MKIKIDIIDNWNGNKIAEGSVDCKASAEFALAPTHDTELMAKDYVRKAIYNEIYGDIKNALLRFRGMHAMTSNEAYEYIDNIIKMCEVEK